MINPGYLLIARGLLASCCLLPLSSCRTDMQTIQQLASEENLPNESAKEAEILYSDSGKVKMKMLARRLNRYSSSENPYMELPEGVHIYFYDDSLNVNSELKADYAIRYERNGKMEAKRSVEVVNIKGEKLNTEHLIWEEEKELIYTEAFVKITTADEVIYGDGLESNQDFTKYKIKNIKGTITLKEEETGEQ
jgi:LPS export ABC transporter protein LptC